MDLCGVSDCQHCDKVSCMWNDGYQKWRREVFIPRVEAAFAAKGLKSPLSSSSCPVVDDRPLHWSVGFYRGRKRVVIAWFEDEPAAVDYCTNCRRSRPDIKYDYFQSLF